MLQAETDSAPADRNATGAQSLHWRPVSLWTLLARADATSVVTLCLWFTAVGLCVWWGMYGDTVGWNPGESSFLGLPGIFDFYLPWAIGVLLLIWFGFEWAVVPVYLSTLFNVLYTGNSLQTAIVDAFHNPLGIAVIYLIYAGFSGNYALRSRRAWVAFLGSALFGGLAISVGAIIWRLHDWQSSSALVHTWIGWWLNFIIMMLVVVAPLVYVLSPVIERVKRRYFPEAGSWEGMGQARWLLAASLFMLTTVFFVLINDQWQRARLVGVFSRVGSPELQSQITTEQQVQRIVVWALAALLAVVSIGGIVIAYRWVRRVRIRAQLQTRQAQAALRRSESRFQHFFENNPAAMWVYDPRDGRFLEVNDAAVRQYGYTREEFLNMTIFDIRPPQEAARLRKLHTTLIPDRNWEAGEWQHRRKDGSMLDVDIHKSSLRLDGRVVHLALIYDISPRRKAQALTEQRAHELRILAAASLELAGAQSLDEVLRISAERARQLTGTNVAMLRCRWNTPDAGIGRQVSLARSYPRASSDVCVLDDEALYARLLRKCPIFFTRDELQQHPWFRDVQPGVQGQLPLGGLLAAPLTSGGLPAGILAVSDKIGGELDAQDQALITQLAQLASVSIENLRLNQALHEQMQELEQRVVERTAELDTSNRELDAFAYSVAHDLRAPLRAVHGFANAVEEDYAAALDADGRNYLARIVAAARNMDALIQDLLAYSRIGRVNLVLEGVPLDEVLRDALAELAGEVRSSGAAIRVQVSALVVQAHRATLRQVLLNLVSNAIKFVAPGKRPEVGIRAWADNGRVWLAVADNGIGIAPEHHERIFNVFERLHSAEAYPGTGVGLSIVKKGLARMHGEINLQSGPGGSTFTLTLKEFAHDA